MEETRRKFPVVSVILVGIATLMALVTVFGRPSFVNIMEFACLSALVVGLILGKKDRNLIVAIGFLALVLFGIIDSFITLRNYIQWGLGVDTAAPMLCGKAITLLCDAAIGISYLIAKPKLAVLKTVACAVVVSFSFLTIVCALIVMRGSGAVSTSLTFLLQTATLYVGALLYTPYKK